MPTLPEGHIVPVLDSQKRLPADTKVRESNLPAYLQSTNVVTPQQLAEVGGLTLDQVGAVVAQARADVLNQVSSMLQGLGQQIIVFNQPVPTTVATIEHNFNRTPVAVSVWSLDYSTQWEFFEVSFPSTNHVRVTFDDAIPFVALVL